MSYKDGQPAGYYDQAMQFPDMKKECPEFKQVGSQVLQDVVNRVDWAYKAFFRRLKTQEKAGFPRFKGRNRYDSFTLKQTGWRLEGRNLYIKNVGRFKLRLSRPVQGTIKTVTVCSRRTGHWYVLQGTPFQRTMNS
jgi:putative transposase